MDRINANVFREMKNAKHGKKVNDIYAPKNKPPDKKKFLKPTGKYELFDDVPGYNNNQPSPNNQLMNYNNPNPNKINNPMKNEINEEQDLYYADPNNYTRDLKTNMVISKTGVVTRTNGTGITTLQAMVNNPKNPNAPEAWQYKIRTQKMEDPDLDIDSNQLQAKKNKMSAFQGVHCGKPKPPPPPVGKSFLCGRFGFNPHSDCQFPRAAQMALKDHPCVWR